ncbi:MAG: hypothetical protein L0I48_05610 [Lactococcus plantarum]|nr:hypothetical protein [Lactococcus plantarum]MDN6070656.1 hypothetical protein [Lactococcus plantarum]MDN6084117.1 hypothetical protein [Lactococcus plantarum]
MIQTVTNLSKSQTYITPKKLYQAAPEKYETVKKNLLTYYEPNQSKVDRPLILSNTINKQLLLGGTSPWQNDINISLNQVAMMGEKVILVLVVIYGVVLLLDQICKFPPFIKSRTGHVSQLSLAQFIYWIVIPFSLIIFISVLAHLTRFLFIPSQYISIPWQGLLKQGIHVVSLGFILVLAITFVHALVGRVIYQILTLCLGIPALVIAYINMISLFELQYLNEFLVKVPLVFCLVGLVMIFIPLIVRLQSNYSVEQDLAYIRLEKLRLPFYILILVCVLIDFVITACLYTSMRSDILSVVILLGLTVAVPIVFAKLVLNLDVRKLVTK